jgi:hypothetical protein
MSAMSNDILWWGNVLVVKHNGKSDSLADMTESDVALVDSIVSWYARNPVFLFLIISTDHSERAANTLDRDDPLR